jgi:hypothetical protein
MIPVKSKLEEGSLSSLFSYEVAFKLRCTHLDHDNNRVSNPRDHQSQFIGDCLSTILMTPNSARTALGLQARNAIIINRADGNAPDLKEDAIASSRPIDRQQ